MGKPGRRICVENFHSALYAECMEQPQTGETVCAARRKAENILLDQAFFAVDADVVARLQAMADRPLAPLDRLRCLMITKAPWDK